MSSFIIHSAIQQTFVGTHLVQCVLILTFAYVLLRLVMEHNKCSRVDGGWD